MYETFNASLENGDQTTLDQKMERLCLSDCSRKYNDTTRNMKKNGQVFLQPYEAAAAMNMDEPKPKTRKTDAMPFLLALVTPLMVRVHEMVTQSAKLVFCDSTASLDNLNTAVFILSCGTSVGALPLAAVMTSSEDAVTLSAGFTAMCHILPKCAFFWKRPKSWTTSITDR